MKPNPCASLAWQWAPGVRGVPLETPEPELAAQRLREFEAGEWGKKHPTIGAS